jgi:transcriptional antiterminator RfaH
MTDNEFKIDWFFAQIKPNCLNIARRNLARQGFDIFLPMQLETRKKRGKFYDTPVPLFPVYIFVGMEPGSGLWRAVNSTYGVTKLVTFADKPAAVPKELVLDLKIRCDSDGMLLPPEELTPGDQVKLTTGPFASFIAEVEKLGSDERVWVLLDIMGRATRVTVERGQMTKM